MTASLFQLDPGTGADGRLLAKAAGAALGALRRLVPEGVVAIYLESQLDELAIARIDPMTTPAPADDYRLELRFASWLTSSEAPKLRTVPQYLTAWIPLTKALVLPASYADRRRGAVVVDASKLAREPIRQLDGLAQEIAQKLAEIERCIPPGLTRTRDHFANSVRRIVSR